MNFDELEEAGATLLQSDQSLSGLSFREVINTPIPETQWVFEGVIPGGCTLLGGTIKEGKSALVEHIGCQAGSSRTVAYFALEYSLPVLVGRLKHLYEKGLDPSKVHFWHQFDLQDSREKPIDFFKSRIEHTKPNLIILDTLAELLAVIVILLS